jgi:hypothetical protein
MLIVGLYDFGFLIPQYTEKLGKQCGGVTQDKDSDIDVWEWLLYNRGPSIFHV